LHAVPLNDGGGGEIDVDSADKAAVDWGESRTEFEERYRIGSVMP
jgi:hypothetical protein